MKLTVGMPSSGDHVEAWFTVRALQLYQRPDEILVVDNGGSDALRKVCGDLGVRYERFTERRGTGPAKDAVFRFATGDAVCCIDSHVLLDPGAIERLRGWLEAHPDCRDLLHGPLVYDSGDTADAMNDAWGTDGKWGTWRTRAVAPDAEPYEIPMHGMGLFACRRDAWLGFHQDFVGFGAEEGYIHTKYRRAGRRVLLLPFLRWSHRFRQAGEPGTRVSLDEMVRNYVIGSRELGFDVAPLRAKFPESVARVEAAAAR